MAEKTEYEAMSLRVNRILKEEFYKFCQSKGLTVSKAVMLLALRCIKDEAAPYKVAQTAQNYEKGNEIRINIRIDGEMRQKFFKACEEIGLPMSVLVRDFMNECVVSGKIPFDI